MEIRVYYEDTDCGGIVYHTNYLKYCERARSELFFKNKIPPLISLENGGFLGFVVKDMNINFISSARLGDVLLVKSKVLSVQNASIKLEQSIFLKENANGEAFDKELFRATITLVCLDNTQKITKIPAIFKEIFNKF